jgi:translation initiation factor 1 (eIF-1/SUI1)
MDLSTLFSSEKEKYMFDEIDKKIVIRFEKQKKTTRTLITGLHYFYSEKEIEKFIKTYKVKLGTGSLKTMLDDDTCEIGFNGNHINTIKSDLIKNGIDKKLIITPTT